MRTYYELLDVAPGASSDEIKRAFRREIARYHPDKVQHLGPEFQAIASTRAAELTEAYRILMDGSARQLYDERLAAPLPRSVAPPAPQETRAPERAAAPVETPPQRGFEQERTTSSAFVRKAVLAKLRDAVGGVSAGASVSTAPGLDAVYSWKGKGGLFRKSEPPTRVLAKYVGHVDRAAVEETWPSAISTAQPGETVCLLLLGSGLAPVRELSATVADCRRKSRKAGPVVVPVDVRDWEALFPPEVPDSVRAILQRLRAGEA